MDRVEFSTSARRTECCVTYRVVRVWWCVVGGCLACVWYWTGLDWTSFTR